MFTENRVNAIRYLVEPNLWFYCRKNENPQELITRVCQQDFTKKKAIYDEGISGFERKLFILSSCKIKKMMIPLLKYLTKR